METVSYSISMVLFAVILAETALTARLRRTVKGSRERYVALTQRRILSWAVVVGFAAQGVVGLLDGQQLSVLSLAMSVYLAYQEITNHKDDDDWFKGRRKKIWAGVKKRLAARPPVRIPSPVFG